MEERMLHFNFIRQYLIELARNGKTASYKEIVTVAGLPNDSSDESSHYLYNLLWDLDAFEFMFERPPLTSFVISLRLKRPGKGFYDWVRLRVAHTQNELENHPTFLQEIQSKCGEYWRNEDNYKRYSGAVYVEYR
jgi:hypothetical protein